MSSDTYNVKSPYHLTYGERRRPHRVYRGEAIVFQHRSFKLAMAMLSELHHAYILGLQKDATK